MRPEHPLQAMTPRRGRPRKFAAPSRAVTLTLPEHVIDALRSVDADLSRAVARLAGPAAVKQAHPPAELARFGRHAVIVISPSARLDGQPGVELVPLPDGRALISFERSLTIPALALMIQDALEDSKLPPDDEATFAAIGEILRSARRSNDVRLQPRNIIVLESTRPKRRTASRRPRSRP